LNLRPPRPGKPGAPGKPGKGGGAAPPTPAAGPAREIGAAAPRPAGRATPGPAVSPAARPAPVVLPRRALGSAGGGDSTDSETMWAPRTIVNPSVRFSSCSTTWAAADDAPGADGLFCLRLVRRNSSVSARTRFMCLSNANICAASQSSSTSETQAGGTHLTGHLAAIIQGDAHPVVDLRDCQLPTPVAFTPAVRKYVRNRPKYDAPCQSRCQHGCLPNGVGGKLELTILPCLFVADMVATRCYRVASSDLQKLVWVDKAPTLSLRSLLGLGGGFEVTRRVG